MADHHMIYDFRTVLDTLMKSQTDLIEIVTKWGEMLDTTPRYVSFNLSGRDQPLNVPNIQMAVDTLNERSLPPDAIFNTVTAQGQGGSGALTAGGLQFLGALLRMTYNNYGIEGMAWHVNQDSANFNTWPLPRYWVHAGDSEHLNITVNLRINPELAPSGNYAMSDFFVFVDSPAKTLVITGVHPGGQQSADRLELTSDGSPSGTLWHVVAIENKPVRGSSTISLHARKMA